MQAIVRHIFQHTARRAQAALLPVPSAVPASCERRFSPENAASSDFLRGLPNPLEPTLLAGCIPALKLQSCAKCHLAHTVAYGNKLNTGNTSNTLPGIQLRPSHNLFVHYHTSTGKEAHIMASNEIEVLDPAATVEKLKKIAAGRALNRRHFMAALGMTGAAAGAGMMSGCSVSKQHSGRDHFRSSPDRCPQLRPEPGVSGSHFLLLHHHGRGHQSVRHRRQLTGQRRHHRRTSPSLPSPRQQITDLLNEIYFDEWNHVKTLQSLLGSAVVARPAINLAAFGAVTADQRALHRQAV